MTKTKLVFLSFLHSLGVLAYIALVAEIPTNAQKLFGDDGKMPGILGPVAFLLLFVLSAAIVGALVLGRPIMLYLEGAKSNAIKMFFYTIGWMFLFLLIVFLSLLLI